MILTEESKTDAQSSIENHRFGSTIEDLMHEIIPKICKTMSSHVIEMDYYLINMNGHVYFFVIIYYKTKT